MPELNTAKIQDKTQVSTDNKSKEEKLKEKRYSKIKDLLHIMHPISSKIVIRKTEKLTPQSTNIPDRLNTLETFAFTSVEKEDNKEISSFFHGVKRGEHEASATMTVVDLWSKNHREQVARKAKFENEKTMIEKFSLYVHKKKRGKGKEKLSLIQLDKRTEGAYKHKIERIEEKKDAKKKMDPQLTSPMKRHRLLRGKTFYFPKE